MLSRLLLLCYKRSLVNILLGPLMLKNDLIKKVAHVSGQPQPAVRAVLDAVAAVVKRSVARQEPVMLFGLGKLHTVQRGEKRARNIRTGDTVIVPPRHAVLLQPSDSLVEAANPKQ